MEDIKHTKLRFLELKNIIAEIKKSQWIGLTAE